MLSFYRRVLWLAEVVCCGIFGRGDLLDLVGDLFYLEGGRGGRVSKAPFEGNTEPFSHSYLYKEVEKQHNHVRRPFALDPKTLHCKPAHKRGYNFILA